MINGTIGIWKFVVVKILFNIYGAYRLNSKGTKDGF